MTRAGEHDSKQWGESRFLKHNGVYKTCKLQAWIIFRPLSCWLLSLLSSVLPFFKLFLFLPVAENIHRCKFEYILKMKFLSWNDCKDCLQRRWYEIISCTKTAAAKIKLLTLNKCSLHINFVFFSDALESGLSQNYISLFHYNNKYLMIESKLSFCTPHSCIKCRRIKSIHRCCSKLEINHLW